MLQCATCRSGGPKGMTASAELGQNLSVYLARLATGTVFRVTDRGRAVALLIPLPPHATTVERLVSTGRAVAATRDLARSAGQPPGRRRRSRRRCVTSGTIGGELPAYFDTSAIVKLIVVEPESDALVEGLSRSDRVSSAVARVESIGRCGACERREPCMRAPTRCSRRWCSSRRTDPRPSGVVQGSATARARCDSPGHGAHTRR